MKIAQQGKAKVKTNNPTKIGGKNKPMVDDGIRGGAFQIMEANQADVPFDTPNKAKFKPKGIDPAYPNRNFVKMSYVNRGDESGFTEYMYGDYRPMGVPMPKKVSGFGHGVERRCGGLRLSGNKNAHRIGKR